MLYWPLALALVASLHAMHWRGQEATEPYHPKANRPYCIEKNGRACFKPNIQLKHFSMQGTASWYGRQFHGRKTSSGERYDMYALTAASPDLPIPSYAKVTNLENHHSVIVRINDRGPFRKKRLIDVSYAAAHHLGFSHQGTAKVKVDWIHPKTFSQHMQKNQLSPNAKIRFGPIKPKADLYIKKFRFAKDAQGFAKQLQARHPKLPIRIHSIPSAHRILIGPLPEPQAILLLEKLQKEHPGIAMLPARLKMPKQPV